MSSDESLHANLRAWIRGWTALSHQEMIQTRCQRALKSFAEMAELFDSGDLAELVEAVRDGKNHPLLLFWLEQRKERGRRPSTKSVREHWSTCALYVRALECCGIRKGHARDLVALAATKSGAFNRDVTVEMVRGWEKYESEALSPELCRHLFGSNPKRILSDCALSLAWGVLEPSYDDPDSSD